MIFIERLFKERSAYSWVLFHDFYENFNQAFNLNIVEAFSQKIHDSFFTNNKGFIFHWIK